MKQRERSKFPVHSGMEQVPKALAPVIVRREGTEGILQVQLALDKYPVPPAQLAADYVDVRVEPDSVHLLFGKLDEFKRDDPLIYALVVSFSYSQFVRQLYNSIVNPAEPGKPTFAATVEQAQRGYPRISDMPRVHGAVKQGGVRANAAAMFVFNDEACIDFFHIDAFALHSASRGANELNATAVMRVVTAPNVLAYFLESVTRAAKEIVRRMPDLAGEVANV